MKCFKLTFTRKQLLNLEPMPIFKKQFKVTPPYEMLSAVDVLIKQSSTNAIIWTASSEFGSYRLCEQRRFRRACASAQSRQNLRCSLIQAVNQEELSDRKPDPWPL